MDSSLFQCRTHAHHHIILVPLPMLTRSLCVVLLDCFLPQARQWEVCVRMVIAVNSDSGLIAVFRFESEDDY